MKKYWPLFAILVILAAVIGVSQYAKSAEENCKERAKEVKAAAVAKGDDSKASNDAENSCKPKVWARYVTWPDGVGALAVILTLFVIAWQSIETRAAAKATEESANAAYGSLLFAEEQLDMMREKERARLEVNVRHNDLEVEVAGKDLIHLIATVSIRNIGASRAFIIRTSGTLITRSPDIPPEGDFGRPLELPDKYIDPDSAPVTARVYCFPTATVREFADHLEQSKVIINFSGFIEYEALGLRWRKEFGYDRVFVGRAMSDIYGLFDPYPNSPMPDRDRITHGVWWINEEQDKPEYRITRDESGEAEAN